MGSTSIEKTALCPDPGYDLWEFTVMPYGLTGATQTCQHGLDEALKDCIMSGGVGHHWGEMPT